MYHEGYPRPPEWNEILRRRAARGTLFNLDDINLGFIRPRSNEDWTLAYCQAELYAEYMLQRFGPQAVARLLGAFGQFLNTPQAIRRAFDVDQADFEDGYREYVQHVVEELGGSGSPAEPSSLAELQRAVRDNPRDPDAAARLAEAYLAQKAYASARRLAETAFEQQPRHQRAAYVLARLHLLVGDTQRALQTAQQALDLRQPDSPLLRLVAALHYQAKNLPRAAELYELGARHFPADPLWQRGRAKVYLQTRQNDRLADALQRLADFDVDDALVRKKLAQLALADNNYPQAQRWAQDALHIDVRDPDSHRLLAESLTRQGNHAAAAQRWAAVVELQPQSAEDRIAWAKSAAAAGQRPLARRILETLLRDQPDNAAARAALAAIDEGD